MAQETEVAALSQFPFCVCDTYRCVDGPIRLAFIGSVNAGAVTQLRFQLQTVSRGKAEGCAGPMAPRRHHTATQFPFSLPLRADPMPAQRAMLPDHAAVLRKARV